MPVEVWGMDSSAGVAILRSEDRWLSVSVDNAWRPAEIDAADIVRCLLSGGMARLEMHFDMIEEAVVACRRARKLVLESGDQSDASLERAFAAQPLKSGSERQALAVVAANLDRLDRFFRRRGQSGEESLRLLLALLDRLEARSATQEVPAEGLPLAQLFEMASGVVAKAAAKRRDPGRPLPPDASGGRRTWSVERLSDNQLSCLALWGDEKHELDWIGRLLGLPSREVEAAIRAAAQELGVSVVELRSADVAAKCRRELEARLGQL
jgi:hypothetical protein